MAMHVSARLVRTLLLLLLLLVAATATAHAASPGNGLSGLDKDRDGKVTREEEAHVVDQLYASLDRDHDGGITPDEISTLIMQNNDAVQGENTAAPVTSDSDGNVRVSRKELQDFWLGSKVRKWTAAEVQKWLGEVGLSTYAPVFKKHSVDGRLLPLLAMDHGKLLDTELGIANEDERNQVTVAILREVFGVPTLSGPVSHTVELVLALIAMATGGIAYFYFLQVQRREEEAQLIAHRVQQAEEAARKTETVLGQRMAELAKTAEAASSELNKTAQEVNSIKQDSRAYEQMYRQEKELHDKIESWLKTKFSQETKLFSDSWANISRQLQQTHAEAKTIVNHASIFSKSNRSLEHRAKLEQIERDIKRWKHNYRQFLSEWVTVSELGFIDQPDLALQLRDLEQSLKDTPESTPVSRTSTVSKLNISAAAAQ